MRADKIRLSYTDPMTGHAPAGSQDRDTAYADIDVVLVVRHPHRSRTGLWSAQPYMNHLHASAYTTWAQHLNGEPGGGGLIFAHIRRRDLLEQIAQTVGTEEWARGRGAWMRLPRDRWWSGRRFRPVRSGPRRWWALPADPNRDTQRGPWPSERAVLDALDSVDDAALPLDFQ